MTHKRVLNLLMLCVVCVACDKENDPAARKQTSGTIETYAGMGPQQWGYSGDGGEASHARVGWVIAVAVDAENNLYIADGATNTIRKVTYIDQIISTHAGTFLGFNTVDQTPYSGDGGQATLAHLNIPLGVSVDPSGGVIISDAGNNVIRYVTSGGLISTICGIGAQGYHGDGGPATSAGLFIPHGSAVDAAGNIYFSDAQNNVIRMIAKATGNISTVAGLGPSEAGYSGDNGPAVQARLNFPEGVAVDSAGNIYISDSNNKVIRKVSAGVITTIAGTGVQGYSGDGGPATMATFSEMKAIAVDVEGNIYLADAGNSAIRKIDRLTGIITTLAGNGASGYAGDGGPADEAQLSNPWGVAVDKDGNVYIADSDNGAVRVVRR